MRFKKRPQLPGAGRTRVGHHHGSHTPTSPGTILLGKMAYHTKQIRRECMHYDYDYDNDKKQDTNSVLKKFFLAYPTSSRDEIQTDFADNVFFQIKPRHSTQDDE